jgi:hypothetical protein
MVASPFNLRYNWCLANLGLAQDYPPRWQPGEMSRPLKFRFRDPHDELLFKLTWG